MNNKLKLLVCVILVIALVGIVFAGNGASQNAPGQMKKPPKTTIPTTIPTKIPTTIPTITPTPTPTQEPIWNRIGSVYAQPVAEPVVMYESNPQILKDQVMVFKFWGHYTSPSGVSSTGYAESVDGITWTDYPLNPILTGHMCIFVTKVDSVYYLYATKNDWTAFDVYSSTDGINFTLLKDRTLSIGSAGTWDDYAVGNIFVWKEGTIWYTIYEAKKSDNIWHLGLATSSDGMNWNKVGTSPVISNTGSNGGAEIHKINGVYWLWCHQSVTGDLPTDIYRYKSTDLLTWINDPVGIYYPRIGAIEGEGRSRAQVGDPSILEVDGKTYMYYISTPDQITGNTRLAISNMSLSELVQLSGA